MELDASDIVAERHLIFVANDGTRYDCRLVFGKIYQPEEGSFYCPYYVIGYGSGRSSFAAGVDSMQALILGIEKARVDLAYYYKDEGTFLYHDNADLGLLPRDLCQY